MKTYATALAATAITTLAAVFTPAASEQEAEARVALLCHGALFTGDYTVRPVPTFAPLTAWHFNSAAGENLVAEVGQRYDGDLHIVPADRTMDCDVFMRKLKDTNYVEWVQPNWMQQHQTNPQP